MAKKRPVGRPKSRPAGYHQHSAWLPDELLLEVKQKLLRPQKNYEFSKLLEHLLQRWLDTGAKLPKET